jgi:hypothetical protein
VADTARHPQTEELRRAHAQWLLATGQDGQAGGVKEREGDLLGAIGLYLKGGLPARAAQVGWLVVVVVGARGRALGRQMEWSQAQQG